MRCRQAVRKTRVWPGAGASLLSSKSAWRTAGTGRSCVKGRPEGQWLSSIRRQTVSSRRRLEAQARRGGSALDRQGPPHGFSLALASSLRCVASRLRRWSLLLLSVAILLAVLVRVLLLPLRDCSASTNVAKEMRDAVVVLEAHQRLPPLLLPSAHFPCYARQRLLH